MDFNLRLTRVCTAVEELKSARAQELSLSAFSSARRSSKDRKKVSRASALPTISLRPRWGAPPSLRGLSSPSGGAKQVRQRSLPRCARSGMPAHLEQWKREATQQTRRRQMDEAALLDHQGFGGDVEGFREFLAHAFGNSARGWRVAIAPDEAGVKRVSFSLFCAALHKIGYAGNISTLWRTLKKRADDADAVGLEHLEPDLADMLDVVARELAQRSPGGAAATFAEAGRREHGGRAARMSFEDFAEVLRLRIGGDVDSADLNGEIQRSAGRIFASIALTDRGVLSCQEFCFLDHWALRRLGARRPGPQALGHVREAAAPFCAPDPGASPRASARRHEPRGLDDFRDHLSAKFGTPARAWRVRLDLKGCGVVSAAEFKEGCRAVGWPHPHMPLWSELCALGGGQATVRALDPETADAVDTLREEVQDRFGTLGSLWDEALDPEGTGVVSRTEFVRIVGAELGLGAHAARRVFSTLDASSAGWLAAMEFGYLEYFGSGPAIRQAASRSGSLRSSDMEVTMRRSAGGTAGLGLGARGPRHAAARMPIWSPSNTTRAAQHRAFSFTRSVKHKWLASAVMDRCRTSSEPSLGEQRHSVRTNLSTTPHGQVFRTTNEFYRQGVKKIAPGLDVAGQTA